ncbi:MAG TPA: POTRA domain-containing protein [Candidatus Acidoferrales bacterium]|nr:POTRA domain-containing protein [Candidatus Acidoferrales bacterium]
MREAAYPNAEAHTRRKRNWKCRILCSLMFICIALRAGAQDAQPDTYAGFEGQHVSQVDISATPTLDVEAYRAVIVQKAGQPFSIQAIRDSVAALQKTQMFSKVQVSIEPQQAGLKILFILQPTSYIGILNFPGATKAFSYTQLLQSVNIPEQTAFVDELPAQGDSALLQFFHANGYFEAQVTPKVQRDDAHRIVNIVFDCRLNRLARFGVLNIQGLSDDQTTRMRASLKSFWARVRGASLKPGKKYSQQEINKSISYIRSQLRKQGRLAPKVDFISPSYQASTGRADLNFLVDEGPHLTVRVMGARMFKRTIQRLIPIYEENSVDQDLVEEGRRNLLSYFQSKGYFDAKVDARLDQQQDSVSVVYEIDKAARHRVEQINFEGNHHFEDKQLQALIPVKKGLSVFGHAFSHGTFSEDLLRKSVNAMLAAYKDAGFADVTVTPGVKDFEPQVDVNFQISEGERYTVADLKVDDHDHNTTGTIGDRHFLNLFPGKPFSPALLQQDRNTILAGYLNRGYENAQFHSTFTAEPTNAHLIDVVYTIDPGPQARISDTVALGTEVTSQSFLHDITGPEVRRGKPISLGNFLTSESDLYNLSIFDWASIKPLAPVSDQEQEEVLVKVHEAPRNSVDFGGGFEVLPRSGNIPVGTVALPGIPPIGVGSRFTASQQSFWGPRVSIQFARHNLRGRAETATLGLVYSRLDQRGTFTYTDPRVRGSSWNSLFSLSAERTTQSSIYTGELAQASLQVERFFDKKKTKNLILRYTYQRTLLTNITIPDLVLPEDQHVRLSTVAAQYVHDTRDKPLDAHHGIYQTATLEISPTKLGSSVNFLRFFGQTSFYKPLTPWLTWANNFRLGLAKPLAGGTIPLSERFFSGGADSIRGFPINGAGPQRPVSVCSNPSDASTCTLISVPVGGNMLAVVNSEARFPIPLKSGLGGVVFYDGGNVYNRINLREFADNFTHTVGFGFRYETPVGPVRFDIGRRLTSVPGVTATEYFVTLGQSF